MLSRTFSREYKLTLLAEYDAATARGAKTALLHREGLKSSYIVRWRKELDPGTPTLTCSQNGCGTRVFSVYVGLCARHYDRLVRGRTGSCVGCGGEPRYKQPLCEDCIRRECEKHGFELIGEYRNAKTRVEVRCLACQSISRKALSYLRLGGACTECSVCERCRTVVPAYKRLCQDCAAAEFADAGFEMLGSYERSDIPVDVKCLTCTRLSFRTLHDIRKGSGCSGCSTNRRFTQEEARTVLAQIGLKMTGTYVNTETPVNAICTRCKRPCQARVGEIRYKIKKGIPVFACWPCSVEWVAIQKRVPEEQARQEFAAAGLEYISGWINTQEPVKARCMQCQRLKPARLTHVRAGTGGCRHCNAGPGEYHLRLFYDSPELREAPGHLYIVEFYDEDGMIFRKFGIGRTDVRTDRIKKHQIYGGRLIAQAFGPLLACYVAEQALKVYVRDRRYVPSPGRIDGGYTECFRPETERERINLHEWLEKARENINMLGTLQASDSYR